MLRCNVVFTAVTVLYLHIYLNDIMWFQFMSFAFSYFDESARALMSLAVFVYYYLKLYGHSPNNAGYLCCLMFNFVT